MTWCFDAIFHISSHSHVKELDRLVEILQCIVTLAKSIENGRIFLIFIESISPIEIVDCVIDLF